MQKNLDVSLLLKNLYRLGTNRTLILVFFLISFLSPVYSGNVQPDDSSLYKPKTMTAEELIRGERLFYGLITINDKTVNCASCHNTTVSDTMNWNPDAIAISTKYLNKSARDLSKVLLTPTGKRMAQVHKDFQFTPADIMMIKAYMDELTEIGLKQNKPVITNLLLFIVGSILFLLSIIDLIITKRLKKRWINYLVLTGSAIIITRILVMDAIALGRSKDYSPIQPVKFSHAIHAGQNQIDCIYCHSYAPYSKTAGIPPENVCMNCHMMVRNGTRSGAFEIAKVISAYENKKPIVWIKVHNLPDYVFFSHAQHVGAGGVKCQECHGKVEDMDIVTQVSDLSMGWCIDCHRQKKLDVRSNAYYNEYRDLAARISKGEVDSVTVGMLGGTECMKCHY